MAVTGALFAPSIYLNRARLLKLLLNHKPYACLQSALIIANTVQNVKFYNLTSTSGNKIVRKRIFQFRNF